MREVSTHVRTYVRGRFLQVVLDVASAWRALNHQMGVLGHLENGLANRLDGTEDHHITGDAKQIFLDRHLDTERHAILAKVRQGAATGSFGLFAAPTGDARMRAHVQARKSGRGYDKYVRMRGYHRHYTTYVLACMRTGRTYVLTHVRKYIRRYVRTLLLKVFLKARSQWTISPSTSFTPTT